MVEANKGFQDKMFQLYTGASLKQVPASAPVPAFVDSHVANAKSSICWRVGSAIVCDSLG